MTDKEVNMAFLTTYNLNDPDFVLWTNHIKAFQNHTEIPKSNIGKLYTIWLCMIKNYSYEVKNAEDGKVYKEPRKVKYDKGRCKYSTASGYDDILFKANIGHKSIYQAFLRSKYFNFFRHTYYLENENGAHINQEDKLVLLWLAFCYKATATTDVDINDKTWIAEATWDAGILKYRNAQYQKEAVPVRVTFNTHILTLNSHGGKMHDTVVVPQDIYLYSPHHLGLQQNYTVAPCMSETFEHIMYERNAFVDFKHGRTIYGPGDEIPNLSISPFNVGDAAGGGAASCQDMTKEGWLSEISTKMIECITNKEPACIIPVTKKVGIEWQLASNRFKIKICGLTTLQHIFDVIKGKCVHYQPYCNATVIMPMCCNASTYDNDVLQPVITTVN